VAKGPSDATIKVLSRETLKLKLGGAGQDEASIIRSVIDQHGIDPNGNSGRAYWSLAFEAKSEFTGAVRDQFGKMVARDIYARLGMVR
jgi:hypothetical protein